MLPKVGVSRLVLTGVLVLTGLAFGVNARADSLDDLYNDLVGGEEKKAVAAAKKLGKMKSDRALNLLMETLLLGAPPKLGIELVRAIGKHESPRSFELLFHYCKNRNQSLRAEAVSTLGRLINEKNKKRVFERAIQGLKDSASPVRAAAARVLVELKKKGMNEKQRAEAEEVLLQLLIKKKDQLAAGIALSKLGGMETARKLAVNLKGELPSTGISNEVPARIVVVIYSAFLKRDDFGPEPVRYWIIKTLGELTSPEAIATIMDYVASTAGKKTPSAVLARKIAER